MQVRPIRTRKRKQLAEEAAAAIQQETRPKNAKQAKQEAAATRQQTRTKPPQHAAVVDELMEPLTESSWKTLLQPILKSEKVVELATFLHQERASKATIFPRHKDTWMALNVCPLEKVRVVILGQDPYHGPHQAHGLAFSVLPPPSDDCTVVPLPPTLKNIFKELLQDPQIENFTTLPPHGHLEKWAQQGVLLLNGVLSVREGKANSHRRKGWEVVTDVILRALLKRPCVFLVWGKPAVLKISHLTAHDNDKHAPPIITNSHPSPLSATRTDTPFMGSRCFSECNKALEKLGFAPIDWSLS